MYTPFVLWYHASAWIRPQQLRDKHVSDNLQIVLIHFFRVKLLTACSAIANPFCPCMVDWVSQTRKRRAARSKLHVGSPPMVHALMFNVAIVDLSLLR
jgi:hypothetical protein